MFIAMNRFKVARGREAEFEEIWRGRKTRLDEMEGFTGFQLLRGPEREDHTLYASHSTWTNRELFTAWTKSEQFRDSHRNAGGAKGLYLGPPDFEGFEAVITEQASSPPRREDAP
ncbi:MAG: antibiotic biosynthesis monooxygenase [Salinarimonadaceae bacterium]|nr:MAG: antibiotic biosynthesis monooxygenase [Salinarimonadaceae bacterium]